MKVLTWNLFHGRSVPGSGRDLREEFTALIAGWDWDVALLQEVPPWWPEPMAARCGAEHRRALTSRNGLLLLRRLAAERWPDVIKSNGGGANAILVRGEQILEHRCITLRHRPERRVAHAVRLASGVWCANLHAQVHSEEQATADITRAGDAVQEWAGGAAAVLGGDFNVRRPAAPGFTVAGGHGVDHVMVTAGLQPVGDTQPLERGGLSDHAPVLVTVAAD